MVRRSFMSGRSKANPGNGNNPFSTFKGRADSVSGLVGITDISCACNFIKNTANSASERVAVIKSLKEAMLIPDTYDILMGTLSRLSKKDKNPEIKNACISTFEFHRDRHTFPLKKVI